MSVVGVSKALPDFFAAARLGLPLPMVMEPKGLVGEGPLEEPLEEVGTLWRPLESPCRLVLAL